MGQKITVSMGITLCVNEEKRNFLRLGIEASEIDLAGDVEEQAQAALVASIKVLTILDEGMQEQIEGIASELEGVPTSLRDEIGRVKIEVGKMQTSLIPNIVNKVKELAVEVKGKEPLKEKKKKAEEMPAAEEAKSE